AAAVEVSLGAVLLNASARRLAIDLLAAIDAAQRRPPVALLEVAAILHPLAALSDVATLAALPQVGALATLADVGALAALSEAGLRAVGNLATELLALFGARPVLAELLTRRPIAIGDAPAVAGIVLPTVVVGISVAVEVPVDVGRPVGIDVDIGVAA